MNSEQKFWLSVWGIVGVVMMTFIISITTYWMDHNAKISKMVKDGVDPVAIMCAMQDDYGNHPTCVILATQTKK